jgi:L-ascorbate metabolism protein UlaG (beta-lactamase superfamily)
VDPIEAFELAKTLNAELTIGMHWGGIFFCTRTYVRAFRNNFRA